MQSSMQYTGIGVMINTPSNFICVSKEKVKQKQKWNTDDKMYA